MVHVRTLSLSLLSLIMIGCGDGGDESLPVHYPQVTTNINILDVSDREEATITDGDTIKLEFDGVLTTIRLIGIDCFESRMNDKAYRQAYQHEITIEEVVERGKQAKTYIQEKLSKRVEHYIEYDEDFKDRYERTLAYIWFSDEEMLNMKIICDGYALPLTIQPNDKYADQFTQCYEDAKAQGLGVWK